MGTWGTAIFSDDLASDLKEDFRDLISDGFSSSEAVEKLLLEYQPTGDPDEEPVFWLALALTQWKLGRLEERTKLKAISIIDNQNDLKRWEDSKDQKKREAVLIKLKTQLLSPQPEAKKIAKQFVAENKWKVGEIIGFRLASGKWILMRVIGHHIDKGGRNAIVEILDWVRDFIPESIDVRKLTVKPMLSPYYRYPQVFFGEPRIKKQLDRIKPTEVISRPSQKPGGFVVFVWPYMDKLFLEIYGLA